ncbi:MAG: amino acid dehydrogenase [Halieaceae bacterium]|nr:amino acid dehydrogenase [Halieaceae bacterium]
MNKVLVIGGGLLGLCSARALHAKGFEVELIEAREGVALESSYGNGGLLTASMSDPWNAPGVHKHLAASLFDPSSAMKLHLAAIPGLISWGLRFLANSNRKRYLKTVKANYQLASYSVRQTLAWREELKLEYGARDSGALKVFRDVTAMAGPLELAEMLEPLGLEFRQLDADATVELEPALQGIRDQISGALYFPGDACGDSYRFCKALAASLEESGVTLRTGASVDRLKLKGDRVSGVVVGGKLMPAESVVVATGADTARLLRGSGLSLPVAPAKGYSVSFDIAGVADAPKIPVIDDAMHAGISPLGDKLRAVGTAEFTGYSRSLSQVRLDNLVQLLRDLYPQVAEQIDIQGAEPWTGLRPMSADGRPFIGPSRVRGLYFNTGHGHLGWTKAVGSACLLADLVLGATPELDPQPFQVHR